MKAKLFLILFCIAVSVSARIRIVLFPIINDTENTLADWVGYSAPDMLFRRFYCRPDIQTWDPVFIFQVDSSAWRLNSDSLITAHAARWKWDMAIGGHYRATDDSVWIQLRSVQITAGKIVSRDWKIHGPGTDVQRMMGTLAYEILVSFGHQFFPEEAEIFKNARTDNPVAYATYARGLGYEVRSKFSEAVSTYSHAAFLDPQMPYPVYRTARIYEAAKNNAAARAEYEKAVELGRNEPVIVAHAARFLIQNETRQKSEAFINQYRETLESCAEGSAAIGMSFAVMGEYQRAAGMMTRAIAAGPCDLETEYILGRTYVETGEYDQAAEVFRRLVEYRPGHSRYYSLLGAAYRKSGRLMESAKILEMAVEYEPRNVDCLINLSVTYFTIGWFGKASQMLARASEVEPRRGGIFLNLGVIAWQTGKKNVARDMFVKAASYPSSVQDACNNKANILLLGGELKNALKIYKKADKAGGKNEVVIYNMGRAYMALGRLREAATCFDDVLLMSSDRMDVLTARADLAARLNNKESEEQFLRKIVRLDPRNRVILSRLVDMKIEDGNLEDAVEFCKSALKEFPGDRTLRLLLPSIYAKIGWHEVAVVEYENLIADDEFTKDFVCYSGMGKSMYSLITAKNHRNYQAAIDTLARAADLDPSNPEIPLMIGEIYLGYLFEPAKAKPYLNKALEKALDNEMRKTIREKLLEADK